jgi:hypothetical protein
MIRLQSRLLGRVFPFSTRSFMKFGTASKTTPSEPQPSHHGEKAVTHHDEHHEDGDHHDDHGHGHGHHAAPYDWRDDFAQNHDYEQDILNRGVPHPKTYHYPFHSAPEQWKFAFPENYSAKDLTMNFAGNQHIGPISNTLRVTL